MTNYLQVARERLSRCEYRSAAVNALVSIAESLHKIADREQPRENFNIAVQIPDEVEVLAGRRELQAWEWVDSSDDYWRHNGECWEWSSRRVLWHSGLLPERGMGPYKRLGGKA